ncbi:Uncharacterised protein [Vibrio cholerae]|nr:Uncharacterised protein [Vibrio cholerae]CSB42484.1 Uncharacterised protein [Vibrio cholerae]
MVGFEDFADSTVNRSYHFVTSRLDRDTVANDFLSENHIWYIFDVYNFTRKRCDDVDCTCVSAVVRD